MSRIKIYFVLIFGIFVGFGPCASAAQPVGTACTFEANDFVYIRQLPGLNPEEREYLISIMASNEHFVVIPSKEGTQQAYLYIANCEEPRCLKNPILASLEPDPKETSFSKLQFQWKKQKWTLRFSSEKGQLIPEGASSKTNASSRQSVLIPLRCYVVR